MTDKFGAGIMLGISTFSLFQDIMGKEAYIEYLHNHWVSGWVTVPLALICFVYALWVGLIKND